MIKGVERMIAKKIISLIRLTHGQILGGKMISKNFFESLEAIAYERGLI